MKTTTTPALTYSVGDLYFHIVIVLATLSTVTVLLRLAARRVRASAFGPDDWWIIVASILMVGSVINSYFRMCKMNLLPVSDLVLIFGSVFIAGGHGRDFVLYSKEDLIFIFQSKRFFTG